MQFHSVYFKNKSKGTNIIYLEDEDVSVREDGFGVGICMSLDADFRM